MAEPRRRIPEATVARLPVYLRILLEVAESRTATISSERLAELAGVNAAKVRKDLSYLGSYGTRGVGYDVEYLLFQMSRELGLTHDWPVVIVGAGNLGHALANYGGFDERGFPVCRHRRHRHRQGRQQDRRGEGASPRRPSRHRRRARSNVIGIIATPGGGGPGGRRPPGRRGCDVDPELRPDGAHGGQGRLASQGRSRRRAADPELLPAAPIRRNRAGNRLSRIRSLGIECNEPPTREGAPPGVSVVVIGLNHRIAPLEILERTSVDGASLPKALDDLCARQNITEAVLLSTCNRTEVYVVAERFHGAYSDVRDFIAPPRRPASRRADLSPLQPLRRGCRGASLRRCSRSRLGRARRVGDPRAGARPRGRWRRADGTARATLNAALPPRARGRQAGAHRDRALPSHRVGVDGRSGDGRRPRSAALRDVGCSCSAQATSARAWRSRSRTQASVRVLVANRTFDRADRSRRHASGGRPVRLLELDDALVEVDVLLTSTGARSILVEHDGSRAGDGGAARSSACWSWTSPCLATWIPASRRSRA